MDFLYQREYYSDAPRPALVLLDLNMPRMDGEEVLERINEDSDLAWIPVIVLTSSEAQEDIVRSYDRSANAYLRKPIDPDEFVETVRVFEEFWLRTVQLPPNN